MIPVDAPREKMLYQKVLEGELIVGKKFDKIVVEYGLQFLSDGFGIFEYRDMKNRRFYFAENSESDLIYVGNNIPAKGL